MRIAITGISVECDAFSPVRTENEDVTVYRGKGLVLNELWLIRGMLKRLRESPEVEVVPLIWATGLPGGPLENQVYQYIKAETVRLMHENGPFDGILLAMHGSLAVANLEAHGDSDYIRAVRDAGGPEVPIGIAFDLHGNLTPGIAETGDVFSALRTAPHRDDLETGYRIADQLLDVIEKKLKPKTVYVKVPILVHGEQAVTYYEPARQLYESLFEYDRRDGIMQTVLTEGYVWHDMPWTGMAVMVTAERDLHRAEAVAEELAQYVWNVRHDFKFMMETADIKEGIRRAEKSGEYPVYLTDSGDNVTSGSPGDLTIVLQHLIESKVKDAVVPGITAPQIVRRCRQAGKGVNVKISLGSEHTLCKKQIMEVMARVEQVGDSFNQLGPYPVDEGPWVRVRINGVVVTFHERRIGIVAKAHFGALGIDPEKHRIYLLKQGYLFPEFESIAKRYILLFSPGATGYDLFHLNYKNIRRPVFPLEPEMSWEASGKSIWKIK